MREICPKVSVITVVFNAFRTLERTIVSVLNQTYPQIEYIIVDGGSTDGTLEIIKKYESKISFWTSESDKGIYDAMNKGIEMATGDWINFMNSGDVFYGDDVIGNFKKIFDSKFDLVYGDAYFKFANPERLIYYKANKFNYIRFGMPFCHQSVFMSAELLKQYKFDLSYKVAADYDLFFKVYMTKNYSYKNVSIPVCIYDLNGISNSIQTLKEYHSISRKYLPFSFIPMYHYFQIINFFVRNTIRKILPMSFQKKIKAIMGHYPKSIDLIN